MKADHVPGGAAHRPRRPQRVHALEDDSALRAEDVNFDVNSPVRRPDQGRADAPVHGLHRRQLIECTTDTPDSQIGEHKYGKSVLDRAISYDVDLYDALKVAPRLDGFDDALESHVGMPIDILLVRPTCWTPTSTIASRKVVLFPRSAQALVGRATRRAPGHSAPAFMGMRNRISSWPGSPPGNANQQQNNGRHPCLN